MPFTGSTISPPGDGTPQSDAPEVFTYLDETMRRANFGDFPQLDISPWLLYGAQQEKIFSANRPEVRSYQSMPFTDYKEIIPVRISAIEGARVPELYFLALEFFRTSAVTKEYCSRTPEGFRSLIEGTPEEIDKFICHVEMSFGQLMLICVSPGSGPPRRLTKHYMDTELLPHFIEKAIARKLYLHAVQYLRYYKMASRGDYVPFLKYMVAHSFAKHHIYQTIFHILSARIKHPYGTVIFKEQIKRILATDDGIFLHIEFLIRYLETCGCLYPAVSSSRTQDNGASQGRDGHQSNKRKPLSRHPKRNNASKITINKKGKFS